MNGIVGPNVRPEIEDDQAVRFLDIKKIPGGTRGGAKRKQKAGLIQKEEGYTRCAI